MKAQRDIIQDKVQQPVGGGNCASAFKGSFAWYARELFSVYSYPELACFACEG